MMQKMANATGRATDALRYREREAADTEAFRRSCLAADGTILPECAGQCSALHALYLNLLPGEAARQATCDALRADFQAHGDCQKQGLLGTAVLLDAVTHGMKDPRLAYTLLLQDKDPSWLYSVDQGATTIWERWNSYSKEKGFGPASMNSFNHYAYGTVAGWMFSSMAGIRTDADSPGFKHFILAPVPDMRIGSVKARFRSPYGDIRSEWSYSLDGEWKWKFVIPANSSARVAMLDGTFREFDAGTYAMSGSCRKGN